MNLRTLLAAVVLVAALPAAAYPALIKHGYASCQACHVDPSGGTQLTAYGRAQSDILVGWHFDPSTVSMEEPAATTGFLFGLVPLPEEVNLSGNLRGGGLYNVTTTGEGAGLRPILMATDLRAATDIDWFVAHVSVGFGLRNVGQAVVVSPDGGPDLALVMRDAWAGAQLFDDAVTVRAGRMPLPFGLRNIEHVSFVREQTRTDIDVDQQYGLALSYNGETVRGELMGIAGNFQIKPDAFRDRGYAGFVEWAPATTLALGVSSLLTYAQKDINLPVPLLRQSHGVFARYAPAPWVALMAEGDAVVDIVSEDAYGIGGVGFLQADIEPVQGIHIIPTLEGKALDETSGFIGGAWLGAAWYPLPHTELRADAIYRQGVDPDGVVGVGTFTGLLQLHLFL
jgi:hypothetical protein